jgi:hypothetical protein
MADALGVSQAKVMRWHQGTRPVKPVDDQLIDVLARKGLPTRDRVQAVEDLERAMLKFVSKRVL